MLASRTIDPPRCSSLPQANVEWWSDGHIEMSMKKENRPTNWKCWADMEDQPDHRISLQGRRQIHNLSRTKVSEIKAKKTTGRYVEIPFDYGLLRFPLSRFIYGPLFQAFSPLCRLSPLIFLEHASSLCSMGNSVWWGPQTTERTRLTFCKMLLPKGSDCNRIEF